ncbi:disease resistance protein RML1A isoform X1 [Capsella rubella]|uniref:disease resistance protein RML1A isoform X1 n=1 Tax=Capsella rubella TaxID=81985 RepID=UPI000CD4C7AF|nr:disease resistance protein RML1A isoform X1 [Capsella rubella]
MASSSSPRTWRYRVFTSFHGLDVRTSFLSHFRKQFNNNGITMFDDQKIVRGETISPALTQAISESRISIVVLSKNYASSSWCLDELLEILKCKEDIGQIVMTVFYGVDPSDVRKQTGDFGNAFNETCARKTEEDRRKWSQALSYVGNIAGEHSLNWDNEAQMIEKIARDVSDKLNVTPSRDFDGMVGMEAHLRKIQSLLDLDNDGVKMVAIAGPAGIGKSTLARALHSLLGDRFQLNCFVDNLRGSHPIGLDEYGLKLRLQEQLLSKIFNQDGTKIYHLGAIKERLCDVKVLIILDDVNNVKQLEALANESTWFGPGSRIIVTTENKELLKRHGINNTYDVKFPSDAEAIEILCRYAFRSYQERYAFLENYPNNGFGRLLRVTELCGKLPLGLRVVGSSLQGKNEEEWEFVMRRLETIIDRDIEEVLRVGYESLHENEQSLFLHIAIFFNNEDGDLVKAMLADNDLDIQHELNILVNKSLIYIATDGRIRMHKLLQQVGRQANQRQEPWKRRILIDAQEICHVLENDTGTGAVSGISFDTTGINEVSISNRALRRMCNLRFLSVYKTRHYGYYNNRMDIPEDMEFPPRLRLLHWDAYPSKCLPLKFRAENLVELDMQSSRLEYLWQGTQLLTKLKKLDLKGSYMLKELPDLSYATNLEMLDLSDCLSLTELPSSIRNLHKLDILNMDICERLQVIPNDINLASLRGVYMTGCPQMKTFPDFSTNIKSLCLVRTGIEEVPASVRHCSRLLDIDLSGSRDLKSITHLPSSLETLDLSSTDIEVIADCIKGLQKLYSLRLYRCRKLKLLPELPASLMFLTAEDCESLEKVTCTYPLNTLEARLNFSNCFKLSEEAQRVIIQRSLAKHALFPGSVVPSEFNHRARGNSLNICLTSSVSSTYKACVVIAPNQPLSERNERRIELRCNVTCKRGWYIGSEVVSLEHPNHSAGIRTKHLCVFNGVLHEVRRDALFVFQISAYNPLDNYKITECGVQILTSERKRISDSDSEDYDNSDHEVGLNDVLEGSEDGLVSCDSESDDAS